MTLGTMEILTALLVIITGFYAWVTYRMLKANHTIIGLMNEQSENMVRPYITVAPFLIPERPVFIIRIANTGKTAAKSLKLKIDRDYYRFDDNSHNLAEFTAFNEVIDSFAPGAEMFFDLAQTFVVLADDADPNRTPQKFCITAKYSYNDKTVIEHNSIDLHAYKHSNPPRDAMVSGVTEIAKQIEKAGDKLKQTIQNISGDR
jgi:hypothetical protein